MSRKFFTKRWGTGLGFIRRFSWKTVQWESCSDKSKNQNPTSSKTGLHLIESSIAAEAKISHLMRRLELLEAKKKSTVNQVNPHQMPNPDCTYCHALNHIFGECLVFLTQQMLSDNMNAVFTRLNNNPCFKTYNLGWKNHPNFSWSHTSHEQHKPNFPNQFPACHTPLPT